jgi:uncharacterized protein
MKKLVFISLALLISGCRANIPVSETDESRNPMGDLIAMQIGEAPLLVEVRDSEDERGLGLSYRESMPQDQGMAFIFEAPGQFSFWMKGMQFPLDMIWVREGRVIDVSENVPPPQNDLDTPVTVRPSGEVDMVIEVNGGWVEKNGVEVGDEVEMVEADGF